jgi:hypothetical protein
MSNEHTANRSTEVPFQGNVRIKVRKEQWGVVRLKRKDKEDDGFMISKSGEVPRGPNQPTITP